MNTGQKLTKYARYKLASSANPNKHTQKICPVKVMIKMTRIILKQPKEKKHISCKE